MNNIHAKVVQMLGDFLAINKTSYSTKTKTFWATFGKKLCYFLFQHLVTLQSTQLIALVYLLLDKDRPSHLMFYL